MQDVLIRLYAKTLFLVFAMICYLFALFKKKRIINGKKHLEKIKIELKEAKKKLIL